MSFEEKREYYGKGLKEALKILNAKLKTNPDSSHSIIR